MRRVTNMSTSLPQNAPQRHRAFRVLPADRRPQRGPTGRAVGGWLPKITAKCFERYGFHSAEIITTWATVAGPELAAIAVPERISWPRAKPGATAHPSETPSNAQPASRRGGPKRGERPADGATLVLRTDPAHALDIEYRAAEIADKLNRYFGYRAIAQVKVRQGPIEQVAQPGRPTGRTTPVLANPEPVAGATAPPHDLATALASLAGAISAERSRR